MKNYGKHILAAVIALGIIGVIIYWRNPVPSTPKSGAYQIQTIGGGGGAQPVNALALATTTPCAIAGSSATSSLMHFALRITTATSSAGTFVIGTSTSAFATSTSPFATITVAANTQRVYTWDAGADNDQIYPNTFVVAGMTNGSAVSYGYTYGGACSAVIVAD